jgi:uncharacterized protein YdeI (YjbR/CyaY-like superfamily)
VLAFATAADWAGWLAENHGSSAGIWIELAKKGSGITSVTYPEAVEVALTWGWIDGQSRRVDDRRWVQKYTPRRPGSLWSKINREKALALIAAGRMQPPGLAAVERAREDGRWESAYPSPKTAAVPPDLRSALRASPRAAAFFATLDGRNRYAILHRILTARRPETRARRIATFVEMLAEHRLLYPPAVKSGRRRSASPARSRRPPAPPRRRRRGG